ncbi:MAG: sulfatase-like hydrolase/transferase [Armatimonadota bacterium]
MRMNRREFITKTGLTALAALAGTEHAQSTRDATNVVFILCDDLAYGDLGCYGQQLIRTPNIDQLASDGIRFTHGYASASWCAPSRCSLLTGFHQGHARVRNSGGNLTASDLCFPTQLKRAGYTTAHIGKWGLGVPNAEQGNMPSDKGFDYFIGFTDHIHAHDSFPDFVWQQQGSSPAQPVTLPKGTYVNRLFADEAFKWISAQASDNKPFFLNLNFTTPHAHAALKDIGCQAPGQGQYASLNLPETEKNYAASITELDKYIGELRTLLIKLNIERNTLIIFTSDNGAHQAGGHKYTTFRSTGDLTGMKFQIRDGGIRVPLIACWPGSIKAGRVSTELTANYDVAATILDVTGSPSMPVTDGVSLKDELLGTRSRSREYLYFEQDTGVLQQAVRLGQWKGYREGATGSMELYDMWASPKEEPSFNMADANSTVVQQIQAIMQQEHTS